MHRRSLGRNRLIGLIHALTAGSFFALAGFTHAADPVATDQSVSVVQGGSIWFFLSLTDADTSVYSSSMIVTQLSGPTNGMAQSYAQIYGYAGYNNYIRYTATNLSYSGADSFTWRASDGSGLSGTATVSITINPNTPPTANASSNTATTGSQVAIYLSKTDPDSGQTFSYEIVTPPAVGSGFLSGSYYYYTATNGYVGSDSFSWRVSDGTAWSAPATALITVNANTPPTANASSNTANCGTLALIYLAKSDPDAGQTYTYEVVTPPAHGGGYISGSYFYYTSLDNFVGADSFTWRVSDGFDWSTPATAAITVNGAVPVPQAQTIFVGKNTPTKIFPVYTGGGGYTNLVVYRNYYMSGPYGGSVVVSNNVLIYTPTNNFVGADGFKWRIAYSNSVTPLTETADATCTLEVLSDISTNNDWTQWRHNEYRTAQTPMSLPTALHLLWRRDMPTSVNPYSTFSNAEYCRPVQLGKTLFVNMVANDSVTAYDTDTGAQKWRYYASGALRRPPVAMALPGGTNAVIFGSDDGFVYCLNAVDGSEIWKFRAAPNAKRAMGFGRLSSVWPVWASPVAHNGKVYFAAGLFPSWCIFAYCLDAATGAVEWRNDGNLINSGTSSALGPLALSYNNSGLFGTSGMANRWELSTATGAWVPPPWADNTHLPPNSGCSFFVDGSGKSGTDSMSIVTGSGTITPTRAAALGVVGTIGSMLAGDGKLFVSTTQGSLYCFGGEDVTPTIYPHTVTPLPDVNDDWTTTVQGILSEDHLTQGLALVWGVGSGRLVEELAKQAPGLMIVAADPDPARLRAIRAKMDAAGWSGARVSTLQGNPMECGFAPCQAALIASEDTSVAGFTNGQAMIKMMYTATRPFGGEIWLPTENAQHTAITGWAAAMTNLPLLEIVRRTDLSGGGANGFSQLKRTGLPDNKMILRPPFRLTAFGDMFSSLNRNASGLDRGVKNGRDLYSWLPVTAAMPGYEPAPPDNNNVSAPWAQWTIGPTMRNSLYDRKEYSVGAAPAMRNRCALPARYDEMFMNTGKIAAFFNLPQDMSEFWGAFQLQDRGGCGSGGCFAGNGIFTFAGAPSCGCNPGLYRIQGQLVSEDAQDEENWINFRSTRSINPVQEEPIRRIGVNLGGLGNRYVAEEDMLWTHHPGSWRTTELPVLAPVSYRGNAKSQYHNGALVEKTDARPRGWVAAAQVTGLDGVIVPLATPLVATRCTTAPILDGNLDDPCWAGQSNRVDLSPPPFWFDIPMSCANTNSFVLFRYDDNNLYVAAGLPAKLIASKRIGGYGWSPPPGKFIKLIMNSREKPGDDLAISFSTDWGKESVGLNTNDWQAALSTNSPYGMELTIPWATLEAAGLWKEQLLMNVQFCGANLNGGASWDITDTWHSPYYDHLSHYLSPVYLDAARGPVAVEKPHTVRLYFAEMEDHAPGQRVFDVIMQGETVLTNLDVAAQAGGGRRELMKEFQNVQIADKLEVDFIPKSGEPMLSAVEIMATYTDQTNSPPAARLDASAVNGPAPLDVSFSARRSEDPDGQITGCVWEMGDGRIARGSRVHHVFAEPGTYTVNLLVLDNRGGTGTTNLTVTVGPGAPSSFICAIRAAGGDYSTLSAWEAAARSDLTSPNSLLFTVSNRGTYEPETDDGHTVTFSGGGTGVVRHINLDNVAYVTGCTNAAAGTVTVSGSGHLFTVSDAGNPVYTAVAECYNDWPAGLADSVRVTEWVTDENHCVTVRAAAGHGHKGKLKDAAGNYSGFAMRVGFNQGIFSHDVPYTRIERVIVDSSYAAVEIGGGMTGSVNRVICTRAATITGRAGTTIANSYGAAINNWDLVLNCTGNTINGGRLINCLSTGFTISATAQKSLSHCVSINNTATQADAWRSGNEGNLANRAVSFVSVTSNDYHLADLDSGARHLGVPGLGADIDGEERTGPYYDVGADQNGTVLSADAFGIPDIWKILYYGSANAPGSGALEDSDGDGLNTLGEYRARTNPTNALSVLRLLGVERGEEWNIVIRWSSEPGVTYAIQSGTNLLEGWPLSIESGIPAEAGGMNVRTVSVHNVNAEYFRVKVE